MSDQTSTSTTPVGDISKQKVVEAKAASGVPVAVLDEATKKKGLGVVGWIAAGWLILIVSSAFLADLLPLNDPAAEVAGKRLAPFQPGGPLLGADANGRDLLARTIYGARTSLIIAFFAVMIGFLIGGFLGLLAGYFRNWAGNALVSVFDILLAIPQLVLALSLVSVLKGSPEPPALGESEPFKMPVSLILIIALGIVSIPLLARITRASTLSWSQREFVTAARAQGATHGRILFREVLPNVLPAMVSIALLGMAIAIVAEGGLAILGASVDPPQATWGTMIATGQSELQQAPFIVWIPIFAVFATAASLNYLGDVMRDRFDVRESALLTDVTDTAPTAGAAPSAADAPLLKVTDLHTSFSSERGTVRAVRGVSLELRRGRTLGIVGESGSGKSVLSRSIMGLMPGNATRTGSVVYDGTEILNASPATMRSYWGDQMAMVFQDPMTALNPVLRVERQITESLHEHLDLSKQQAKDTTLALLTSVGIPEPARRLRMYPHEMSGGMRQRIMIAIALACGPRMLFADEPTTALDVTVQAQILDLLQDLQRDRQMAMILVTHDLGVVAGRAHDIAVMYAGQIVEQASAKSLFANVRHPYTEALLQSIPKLEMAKHTKLDAIGGRPPDLVNLPEGCPFAPRCRYAQDRCHTDAPELLPDPVDPSHLVACHFPVGTDKEVARHEAAVDGTLDHPEDLDVLLDPDPDHDDLPPADLAADPEGAS